MTNSTPATAIPLADKALIEASAGTGKTWTLTGILLRLLLEDSPVGTREPREIIATTFTRKAAAEMRRRVQARFDSFLLIAKQLPEIYQKKPEVFADDAGLKTRIEKLLQDWQESDEPALQAAAQDKINCHLLTHAAEQGLDALIALLQRCDLCSQSIDELYIGTLDGLCQRWLHEFSLETGSDARLDLLEGTEEEEKITELVHQHLRREFHDMSEEAFIWWRSKQANQYSYKKLIEQIKEKQNFADLNLEPLPNTAAEIAAIERQRANLRADPSYSAALEALRGISEEEIVAFARHWQKEIVAQGFILKDYVPILDYDIVALCVQLRSEEALSAAAIDFLLLFSDDTLSFAKKRPKEAMQNVAAALKSPVAQTIKTLARVHIHEEKKYRENYDILYRFSALQYVRQTFPDYLERSAQITFSEKLARLNRALAGEQGSVLARYISHRYPVILVDESQDLNAAQAQLLEQLHLRHFPPTGFLLLVGDPKQAIYRFRGGDVNNYLRLREHFAASQRYTLSESFRSSKPLIDGLNDLYGQNENSKKLAEDIHYEHMSSGAEEVRRIVKADGSAITQSIHFYAFDSAEQEQAQIIALVQLLSSEHSPYALKENGVLRPIRLQDILILLRGNDKLSKLQKAFQMQGVEVKFGESASIFADEMAQEIGILLQAIDQPRDLPLLRRLLSGILFSQNQNDLARLQAISAGEIPADKQMLTIERLSEALQKANEKWQRQQPLAALQGLLSEKFLAGRSIWEHLAGFASPFCERYLLDLRKIQQIIADRGSKMPPAQFLHWWQQALSNPPTNEWAKASPLSADNALRLMTIHSAKGLEAPVVISALGGIRNEQDNIYIYHNDKGEACLSVLPKDEARTETLEHEHNEELARLLYVALTRPSDLLFVGIKKGKDKYAFPPLEHLKPFELENSDSIRLLKEPLEANDLIKALRQDHTPLKSAEDTVAANTAAAEQNIAQPSKLRFEGWHKSSFTALTRDFDTPLQAGNVELPDFIFDEQTISDIAENVNFQLDFPRGARAGSFLHSFLERLKAEDFSNYDTLFSQLKSSLYPAQEAEEEKCTRQALRQWFETITQSNLISGSSLAQIPLNRRANEMKFVLGVNAQRLMPFDKINALFEEWGKNMRLKDQRSLIGFLRGEIDLCYEHEGRYYVLDYKSNHLGNKAQDYEQNALERAMDEHHYWLQALIYQTALHRWLGKRLPDYQAQQHLGDVEYFFVRGCGLGADSDGHLRVFVPLEILFKFDALLRQEEERTYSTLTSK